MADVINLNKLRKQRRRAERAEHASRNRVQFERSKVERARNRNEQERRATSLDGKRLEKARPDDNG